MVKEDKEGEEDEDEGEDEGEERPEDVVRVSARLPRRVTGWEAHLKSFPYPRQSWPVEEHLWQLG